LEAADPDYRKKQRRRREEERVRLCWNADGTALVREDCDPEVYYRTR